jgi:hypothetical protein
MSATAEHHQVMSPTAGLHTGKRLPRLEDPFRLYRSHTITNCIKTGKASIPQKRSATRRK